MKYMTPDLLEMRVLQQGLTYDAYMDQWRRKNALPMKGLDKVARRMRYYSIYNLERQERVDSIYVMNARLRDLIVSGISGPQTWMFITEDWCVDSAHSLPILREAVALRQDLTLRILLRDENLDIMDRYLTEGRKSVPVFVGFDSEGRELFKWGPYPKEIHVIREELKASGAEGRVVSQTTVDWYAAEGWLEVERELIEMFEATI